MSFRHFSTSEALEARRFLSVSLSSDGMLNIMGTESDDVIDVHWTADYALVEVVINGDVTRYHPTLLAMIELDARGGDDRIVNTADGPARLVGGDGNDSFNIVSIWSTVTSDGGDGNDTFSFHGATNILLGGNGNDTFTNQFDDDDALATIDGGAGLDTEFFTTMFEATVQMGPGLERINAVNAHVIGNELDNEITLTCGDGPFTAHGGAGNDVLRSIDFSASLCGDGGNDTLVGIANDPNVDKLDTLNGAGGNDRLIGSRGFDRLLGGSGNDTMDGGPGADEIYGGGGSDTADYSNRIEPLSIVLDNQPNDGAVGEHDNVHSDIENVNGGGAADRMIGSPFANRLKGNGGNDTIYGGDGNDTLIGGSGKDRLYGQAGKDTIVAKGGSRDTVDGGSGLDIASRDRWGTLADLVLNVERFL